ncbi:hypothetical protein [Neorhizobium alkalisoli]|uniref:Uncharacterized protein n=1 Tax=Neorhizobium alkalisoli TaxID=528178 RepID=A0A561QNI7_9HYPH|nr:hypothetical protein [Neorhizobium alkalisoli]TWF51933.1 hypothetical protein FHW37_10531 [Neorhizobium alkalisoli]
MPATEEKAHIVEPRESEIDQVLSHHDGDALAAVKTLLEDCRHLRQQMSLAETAMSSGFTRGWRPSYDR